MLERLRRSPETSQSPEIKNGELFARADRYARVLIDATGREEAVVTAVSRHRDGTKVGAEISVFRRTESGFQIDFYLNSLQPTEVATFDNISEDPDMGPQTYRATFSNMRLPYDQMSYTDPANFIHSLESMFGELPDQMELDPPYDRFA